jgi:outer membrane protein OmpA-like peptidoglycan-associated protein
VEVLFHGEKGLNDRVIIQGSLELAPVLSVADHVKGDYDNPDRTASASYGAYFWSTKWGLRIMLNPRMWLESGFTYQMLHGDGHENPDYRFLEHDYNRYGFYALFGTRFFGAKNTVKAEPVIGDAATSPPVEAQPPSPSSSQQPQAQSVIQNATVAISKITPSSGLVNSKVHLTLEGTGFQPGIQVTLHAGPARLAITDMTVISENQLSGSFDLTNAATGNYDLTVTNADGQSTTMSNAFMVKRPEQPALNPAGEITVFPRSGFNNGSILITLKGAAMMPGTTVKMTSQTGVVVPGEVVRVQPGEIAGFFNLKDQKAGFYDFYLSYPDGHKAKADENFEVIAFSQANYKFRNLLDIYFDVDKATISGDPISRIKDQFLILRKNPEAKIVLIGYTDARGSYSYNLSLSMRRAEAVKELLTANGIKAEQISIYAYGKEKARQGATDNVWRNDRRVDVVIYEEK